MSLVRVSNNNLNEVVKSGVSLVDFYADWCGPCKMIAPVIEDLSHDFEGKAKIVKLNVDENERDASFYQVFSIPTLIVFKDGIPVDKVVGFQPKPVLANLIKKHLV